MIVPLSVLEFRDRAETYFRDKTGVIDGDRTFTYGQYAGRTHRLANALRSLGVQRGDRVSFLSYNTHQLLEAYHGVIEAGAILNPINVRLTPQDIGYILNHSGTVPVRRFFAEVYGERRRAGLSHPHPSDGREAPWRSDRRIRIDRNVPGRLSCEAA